ncbi:hypothetical protein V8F06_001892 [Rhypophila decipiens]
MQGHPASTFLITWAGRYTTLLLTSVITRVIGLCPNSSPPCLLPNNTIRPCLPSLSKVQLFGLAVSFPAITDPAFLCPLYLFIIYPLSTKSRNPQSLGLLICVRKTKKRQRKNP